MTGNFLMKTRDQVTGADRTTRTGSAGENDGPSITRRQGLVQQTRLIEIRRCQPDVSPVDREIAQ